MDDLSERRGVFRLGVLITGMTVLVLTLVMTAPVPFSAIELWWWLALALTGVTGIGLLLGARFARVLAGLLLLVLVVLAPVSLLETLDGALMVGADPLWLLTIANAVATTLLLTWMSIRAIQMLLGRRRRSSVVTVRIVGGVLAIVAANHLWLVSLVGFSWTGSFSIQMSAEGTHLVGFFLWPVWHMALLAAALVMIAGPRRMLGHAATVLLLLFAILVPLVIVEALRVYIFAAALTFFGMTLIPVYLCWWLRDELRSGVRAAAAAEVRAGA